jgi:hypothetical protein
MEKQDIDKKPKPWKVEQNNLIYLQELYLESINNRETTELNIFTANNNLSDIL